MLESIYGRTEEAVTEPAHFDQNCWPTFSTITPTFPTKDRTATQTNENINFVIRETIMSKMKPWCQKWNHKSTMNIHKCQTMSKLIKTLSKIINKSTKGNFQLVKKYSCCILTSALHQWKWSVRFGPLMTSMKTDFVTKISMNDRFWQNDFVSKI